MPPLRLATAALLAVALFVGGCATDFGQTLALWGLDEGPYLLLPVLAGRPIRATWRALPSMRCSAPSPGSLMVMSPRR